MTFGLQVYAGKTTKEIEKNSNKKNDDIDLFVTLSNVYRVPV